ncbi:MAG: rhomboid family intramembrane serine protease [Chloroflexi bacterium]|nr:rhomboid family intramembrane serine protease [Chloroflexota bacterium]
MNEYPASSLDREPAPPPQPVRVSLPDSVPYVTYTIVGITVVFYLLQLASVYFYGYANAPSQMDWLEYFGAQISTAIRAGQIWRLITPVLLHGSILHIGFNMYALIIFGTGLERHFGKVRFLLLYLLGGFSGNVFSFLLTKGYSIGASTAIFGLLAAEGVFLYQNRKLFGSQARSAIGNIIFVAAINLFIGLAPGIDNWGHIGGLLGGLIFTWFAGPLWGLTGTYPALQLADQREPRQVLTGAAVVILIFGVLTVVGMR